MQDWFVVRNRILGERINAPGIIDDEEDGAQPPVIAAPAARAGNPQVTAPPVRLVVNGDVIALDNAPDAAVVAADIVRAPVATGKKAKGKICIGVLVCDEKLLKGLHFASHQTKPIRQQTDEIKH